nr:unnamed protein product [Callosobruchus analis]CAI5833379.1 unnamed protein product [Callosobruchus analis]
MEKFSTSDKTLSMKQFRVAVALGLSEADPETPQRGRKYIEPVIKKTKPQIPLERRTSKAAHMPVYGNKVRCAY